MLFAMVMLMKIIDGSTFSQALPFAFVISISIAASLATATIAGAGIPLVMKMVKVDPAVASGPFITTVNDIVSLLIYFGLATLLMNQLF